MPHSASAAASTRVPASCCVARESVRQRALGGRRRAAVPRAEAPPRPRCRTAVELEAVEHVPRSCQPIRQRRRSWLAGGAAEDARRLGRALPRLRSRAALLRGHRRRAAVRDARSAASRCLSRCPACGAPHRLRVRGRVRGVRSAAAAGRGLRFQDPEARPLRGRRSARKPRARLDRGEADHRDGLVLADLAVVELARGSSPSPRCGGSPGCRARSRAATARPSVFTSTLSMTASKTCSRGL